MIKMTENSPNTNSMISNSNNDNIDKNLEVQHTTQQTMATVDNNNNTNNHPQLYSENNTETATATSAAAPSTSDATQCLPFDEQFITDVLNNDVLCGRGSGPNERIGNWQFRSIVNSRKEEYLAIPPRDHYNKNRIANEVVAAVRAGGGRFLKRAPVDCGPGELDKYVFGKFVYSYRSFEYFLYELRLRFYLM